MSLCGAASPFSPLLLSFFFFHQTSFPALCFQPCAVTVRTSLLVVAGTGRRCGASSVPRATPGNPQPLRTPNWAGSAASRWETTPRSSPCAGRSHSAALFHVSVLLHVRHAATRPHCPLPAVLIAALQGGSQLCLFFFPSQKPNAPRFQGRKSPSSRPAHTSASRPTPDSNLWPSCCKRG